MNDVPIADEPGADDTGRSDDLSAGVEQFQKAALDALAAARAMLDAAETIVKEPGAVESLFGTIGEAARSATHTVAGFAAGAAQAARARHHDEDTDDDGTGFEHIDIG